MTNEKIVLAAEEEVISIHYFGEQMLIKILLSEAAFRAIQDHAGAFVLDDAELEDSVIIQENLEDYASGEPIEPERRQFIVILSLKDYNETFEGKRRMQYFLHVQEGKLKARQDINVRLDSLMRTIMNLEA